MRNWEKEHHRSQPQMVRSRETGNKGAIGHPTMDDGVYAKNFRATPTNAAPAASTPKPSNDAMCAAPVLEDPPEEVLPEDPDPDPDPVAPAEPSVGDAPPPLMVVVPLMSGQMSIHTYAKSNVRRTLLKRGLRVVGLDVWLSLISGNTHWNDILESSFQLAIELHGLRHSKVVQFMSEHDGTHLQLMSVTHP
jgi:hypothetical protein